MKCFIVILLALLISLEGFTQAEYDKFKAFGITSVSGELGIGGQYRQQDRILKTGISESLESYLFSGSAILRTSSYIWHPNFLILNLDANYHPETKQENYLVIPDRSEVRTIQRLYLSGTFFNQKPVSLNGFINLNKNYINNENLTNIRTDDKKYGGSLFLRNKYLPLSISYVQGKRNQKELISGRVFKDKHTGIQGRLTKSFFERDNHKLSYDFNDYFRQDNNLAQVKNLTQEITLNDNVFFDRDKKYYFSSLISNFDQEGDNNYQRFQMRENLSLILPAHLRFNSNYFFNNIHQEIYTSTQNRIKSKLSHELYLSLRTSVYYEYSKVDHTAYNEINDRQGLDIQYTKKIPKGQLSLSYHYFRYNQNMDSKPVLLQVFMEEHILQDDEIVLLENEHIDIETIVVKDVTGTIIYQENLDYVLIERNTLVEIQRIPGGQISNGQLIYVDYTNTRNDSFKYITNNNTFNIRASFFDRLVEVYYRNSKQDYSHIEKSDYLTLNYYTQNVYGTRITYKIFSGGIEYDDYNSNLIPYKLLRYYFRINGSFRKRFIYSLNLNYRDYKMINEDINQKFGDVSCKLAYNINTRSKINVDAAYRNQKGREIDLDLFTLRSEYTSCIRQLYFTVGVEMYKRYYLNEDIDFMGGYIKIVRKF